MCDPLTLRYIILFKEAVSRDSSPPCYSTLFKEAVSRDFLTLCYSILFKEAVSHDSLTLCYSILFKEAVSRDSLTLCYIILFQEAVSRDSPTLCYMWIRSGRKNVKISSHTRYVCLYCNLRLLKSNFIFFFICIKLPGFCIPAYHDQCSMCLRTDYNKTKHTAARTVPKMMHVL